jgi:hypothetical protein
MSDPSGEPGLTGDIRRILSGIRTLQLDVVAIKTEQTTLRTDVMAQLDPKEVVRKIGEDVRGDILSLNEQISALTKMVLRLQTRMDQLEEGRGEGSL